MANSNAPLSSSISPPSGTRFATCEELSPAGRPYVCKGCGHYVGEDNDPRDHSVSCGSGIFGSERNQSVSG
jgi:hypothetical protein